MDSPTPTSAQVKKVITEKFGTLPRFAALVGETPAHLTAIFKRKHYSKELGDLLKLANKTPAGTPCFELTGADRARLWEYLKKNHGGSAAAFARTAAVDGMAVSHVISGLRKRKTAIVRAVFAAAGLALSDSCPPQPARKAPAAGQKLR